MRALECERGSLRREVLVGGARLRETFSSIAFCVFFSFLVVFCSWKIERKISTKKQQTLNDKRINNFFLNSFFLLLKQKTRERQRR